MHQMNRKMQQQIEWRRAKVMELLSKGESNQSEIARILHVDKSIICRDIAYLRQQAKENIKKYIDEMLPEEYEKCLVGLTQPYRSLNLICLILSKVTVSAWMAYELFYDLTYDIDTGMIRDRSI